MLKTKAWVSTDRRVKFMKMKRNRYAQGTREGWGADGCFRTETKRG